MVTSCTFVGNLILIGGTDGRIGAGVGDGDAEDDDLVLTSDS